MKCCRLVAKCCELFAACYECLCIAAGQLLDVVNCCKSVRICSELLPDSGAASMFPGLEILFF